MSKSLHDRPAFEAFAGSFPGATLNEQWGSLEDDLPKSYVAQSYRVISSKLTRKLRAGLGMGQRRTE